MRFFTRDLRLVIEKRGRPGAAGAAAVKTAIAALFGFERWHGSLESAQRT
jgi:hypothetical protein